MNLTYIILAITLYIAFIVTLLRAAGINRRDPLDLLQEAADDRRFDWHMRQSVDQIIATARTTGDLVAAHNALWRRGVPDVVRLRVISTLEKDIGDQGTAA